MGDRDSRRAALVHPRPSPPQHAFERGPRRHLPAQLGEHPGRNERGDEHCEPDPDHGQHGITGRPEMNRVFPSKKKCFPQLPGDRRDRSHGERVAVPLPIQQAVSHQSVELLGNHRHVILIANESGIESHSEEHRKHHAHHCRGIGVSRNLTSRDRVVDNRGIKPSHGIDDGSRRAGHHGEANHRAVHETRSVCRRHERRQLVQQRVFAVRPCNAIDDNRICLCHQAVVDLLAGVEVVVHGRAAQTCARGDGLEIGRVISAFVDHLAGRAKNASPCLGRVGTYRAAPPAASGRRPSIAPHEQTLWHC